MKDANMDGIEIEAYGHELSARPHGHAYQAMTGSLDEIRFYKSALTSESIISLSNNDVYTGS